MYDKTKLKKDYSFITLVLLNQNLSVVFENTVYPNQGPSDEAIWSGSTLFSIMSVSVYLQLECFILTGVKWGEVLCIK